MTPSPRGGRTTFGLVPSPPPPTEEEAGQPRPSGKRHLVGCRASRRRRRTSAASPQRADLKQTHDASTLAKDLLGVTIVPETTVQSVPDATSTPTVDRKVPTDSHLVSFGFGLDLPSDSASVSTFIEASPNPRGYRVRSPWDRLTADSTYEPSGSEERRKMASPTSVGISPDLVTPVSYGTS
jgi:hypothetical protein